MQPNKPIACRWFWCTLGVAALTLAVLFVNRFCGSWLFMPAPVISHEGIPVTQNDAERIAIYDLLQSCPTCRIWDLSAHSRKTHEVWHVTVSDSTNRMVGGDVIYVISGDGKIISLMGGL
jgi:hypothetical protein